MDTVKLNPHMVTVKVAFGTEEYVQESKIDAFLSGLGVSRRGELCELAIGKGVRVVMPRPVLADAISDLLAMLEPEQQREILANAERALC